MNPHTVFVVGSLRSGSTLLRLMLNRHSAVANPGELDFLFDFMSPDGDRSVAANTTCDQHEAMLVGDRIYEDFGRRFGAGATALDRVVNFVEALREPGRCLSINLHRNFFSAAEVFPYATFIHLIRDPRDCARSSVAMGWAGMPYYGVEPWLTAERSWEKLKAAVTPERWIEVRYEELVTTPEPVLRRLCEFIGVHYEQTMLDLGGTTYDTPSGRFANQWRRGMQAQEIAQVESRAWSLMQTLGYPTVAQQRPTFGPLSRGALWLQDRLGVYRYRVRTYGIGLVVSEVLARRLRAQGWLARVRCRTNAIDRTLLK